MYGNNKQDKKLFKGLNTPFGVFFNKLKRLLFLVKRSILIIQTKTGGHNEKG